MYCPSSKRQEEKRRNLVREIKRGECFKNETVRHCSNVVLAPYTLCLDFFKLMVCLCVRAMWLQSCQTLCDPMDCSTPHPAPLSVGILQPRILERVAVPFSRGSSQPRDQIHASYVSC